MTPRKHTPPTPIHRRVTLAQITATAALLAACAALIGSLTGAFVQYSTAKRLSAPAAQHVAEAAAVAPNPDCHPAPGKGVMGVCAPTQALQVAAALGGTSTPVHRDSQNVVTALFDPSADAARAPPVDRLEDVSSWQGCGIDWNYRRSYLSGAIFKSTEGAYYQDKCLRHNVQSARAAHLPLGTYTYDRSNTNPTVEADYAVRYERANGVNPKAAGALPSTIDTESNDGGLATPSFCGHVSAYINRYESDTGRKQMWLYTSLGTWSGGSCPLLPAGTMIWNAAYGPSWNNIAGRSPNLWQYSDGIYGPPPHLDGTDSDIWLGSHQALVGLYTPTPPVPARFTFTCSELDRIQWWKAHHGSVSTHQHQRAVALRRDLAGHRVHCTAQPHSRATWTYRPGFLA